MERKLYGIKGKHTKINKTLTFSALGGGGGGRGGGNDLMKLVAPQGLTFMSRINFMLRCVENEKSFVTSHPGIHKI